MEIRAMLESRLVGLYKRTGLRKKPVMEFPELFKLVNFSTYCCEQEST